MLEIHNLYDLAFTRNKEKFLKQKQLGQKISWEIEVPCKSIGVVGVIREFRMSKQIQIWTKAARGRARGRFNQKQMVASA